MVQVWDSEWEIEKSIPGGGQGETYLVKDRRSRERVGVLKKLRHNQSRQARYRMRTEVAALQELIELGASVPRVLDHNMEQVNAHEQLYVVSEFIPGRTLREVVESDGPFGIDKASRLVLSICQTIRLGHGKGILHRDLKPENLIVRDIAKDDIVVIDYGLSFNAAADDELTDTDETFRNKFIALPETTALGGNKRDPRSDVAAICGLFYFMLTKHQPGPLLDASVVPPHRRPGFSVKEVLRELPNLRELELLLDCGLAQNINARFQDVEELMIRLNGILNRNPDTVDDTFEVARQEFGDLQRIDRVLQLAELKHFAEPLMQRLIRVFDPFKKDLYGFRLGVTAYRHSQNDLPKGIDLVASVACKVQVNVPGHKDLCLFVLVVGARGQQCVLLKRRSETLDNAPRESSTEDWQEWCWFEKNALPEDAEILQKVQIELNNCIRRLAEIVKSKR